MNASPDRAPNFLPAFAPTPVGAHSRDATQDRAMAEVVPSASRMAGKIRNLVARHPEETLSVLRRWMVENTRGG